MASHYCYLCGDHLGMKLIENRQREVCPSCGWIQYEQLKVGAGIYVERDGSLLLVRRSNSPWRGCWNLPAGYVEADERPDRAAEREAFEETGLHVRAEQIAGVYYFDDDQRGNGVLLVYGGYLEGGEAKPSAESNELGFFLPEEIPDDLTGGGHDQAIRAWKEKYGR